MEKLLLGSEPLRRFGPFNLLDAKFARATAKEEMSKLGIDVRDIDQPVCTLSAVSAKVWRLLAPFILVREF